MPLFSREALSRYDIPDDSSDEQSNVASSVKKQKLYRLGQGSLIGSVGSDIGTTLNVLNNGGNESNALYGNDPSAARLIATKAATTLPMLYLMKKLKEAGHDRLAGLIGLGVSAAPGLATIHNIRQMR